MIYWPNKLAPVSVAINLAPRSLGGSAAISGMQQNVSSSAGVWIIAYEGIAVVGADRIKMWRAIQAQTDGRVNKIVLPIRNTSQLRPGGKLYGGKIGFSDGGSFSDGSQYASDIGATMGADAARGATEITIAGPVSLLDAGQHFSIGERLHIIKYLGDVTSTSAAVKVSPPLREAAVAGTSLNFIRPVCTVRLGSDTEMDLTLTANRYGSPTVRFVEDLS